MAIFTLTFTLTQKQITRRQKFHAHARRQDRPPFAYQEEEEEQEEKEEEEGEEEPGSPCARAAFSSSRIFFGMERCGTSHSI
jgi:hypothetical protein